MKLKNIISEHFYMPKSIESNTDYISNLEALIELAHSLKQESDFKQILQSITEKACVLFAADFALLMMINPQTQHTIKTVFSGQKESADRDNHAINSSISGWVIKYKSTLLSRDINKDARFRKSLVKNSTYKSVSCSPLYAEGLIIGTLLLVRENELPFDDQEMEYLNQFSSIVSPFLRNVQKIQQYFEYKISDKTLLDKYVTVGLLGKCRKFVELLQAIEIAAKSDIRVMIEGESGTGKELVAKAIHKFGPRGDKKFVALDCGAIPDNLMESTLFGHVKGAFSGATEHQQGLIQEANEGTLFLDEITNIPLSLQTKLLRYLQEGEIRQIGSSRLIKVNVRIVSASSSSLFQLVEQNKFREDLFYRLYVYPVKVPSLGDRKEDIPLLASYFLKKYSQQQNKNLKHLHEELIDYFSSYDWSGNIRQLENFIEHLVALAPPNVEILDHEILPKEYQKEWKLHQPKKKSHSTSLFKHLADYEAELIRKSLTDNDWNQARAARDLKVSEATIRYKINKYGIVKPKT
jgi:transcriptional regulator with GAF, ATPase, and Fis domain